MKLNNAVIDEYVVPNPFRSGASPNMHVPLKEEGAGLPSSVPVQYDDQRKERRRGLMLDDGCLDSALAPEYRCHVVIQQYLYLFACILTVGTIAIIAYWPACRRRKERLLSSTCTPEQADFVIVEAADGHYEVCPIEEVAERPLELQDYLQAQRVQRIRPPSSIPLSRRMYVYRHTRYLYRPASRTFLRVESDEVPAPSVPMEGLPSGEAAARLTMYGHNVIDVPIPPIPILLVREVLHPFVIFQVWAVIVWLTEAYYSFSAFILCTALLTAGLNLRDVLRNLKDIRRLSRYVANVTVLRDGGQRQVVPSDELVPGDVVVVPRMKLPCDMVVVQGQATVMEAMLTGEATVVVKTPAVPASDGTDDFPSAVARADMRNTLFGGTSVVELRVPVGQDVLAVVTRTGYDTVKGRLVLSILYPRASPFKFMDEAIRFVGILFGCAMVGFVINARALSLYGAGPEKIVQRGADLITIVVPPALPLAVTVGTLYALVALRKHNIFCISPPKVNMAGKINCFCFDKTGTLTTEGLQLSSLRPAVSPFPQSSLDAGALAGILQASVPAFLPDTGQPAELSVQFQALLACCHSLTHVAGELAGDPLELKTFAFTRATMIEPHSTAAQASGSEADPHASANDTGISLSFPPGLSISPMAGTGGDIPSHVVSRVFLPFSFLPAKDTVRPELAKCAPASPLGAMDVLHVFPFVPALQRMGVMVQPLHASGDGPGTLYSYLKGSPEAVHAMCVSSTLPADFWDILDEYGRRGLRVLGAAYREFPGEEGVGYAARAVAAGTDSAVSASLRKDVEVGLTFLGFIVLENPLKPETAPVIARLRNEAGLSMHMATGDNGVSAVAIARECLLVEPGARVFLGDCDKATGSVTWTDVDDSNNRLDPLSLLPLHPITHAPSTPASATSSVESIVTASMMMARARGGKHTPTPSAGVYRLAMTGRAFDALKGAVADGSLPARTLAKAVINTAVFARMSPENKASLVEALQAQGLYVGMIGDGANDSMALRAAHVGISLSQVEASVAAPFTYATPNPSIDAIPVVLAEGRGALATSFCLFQFMALYSTIQFATAVQIAFSGSFLSNNMYLFQDLFVVFILSFSLGQTASARILTKKRPSGRLGSLYNLTITFGFIALTFAEQALVYTIVRGKSWFGSDGNPAVMIPGTDAEGTNSAIPETTSLFLMANFQYVACAAIFASGAPWKASPLTNTVWCGWMVVVAITSMALLLAPTSGAYSSLSLQVMPIEWHGELCALSLAAFASYFGFMAAVRAAKATGVFSMLERRGPPKLHKELRNEWNVQFASGRCAPLASEAIGRGSIRRPASVPERWNVANSIIEPTTPLPL